MKPLALCAVFFLTGIVCAQDAPPVEGLIKQLGSADFRKRDVAMKSLLTRPDAEQPLRAAMKSQDVEIATRAAILVHELEYRRSGLHELDQAIDDGHVERAIRLIVAWPEAKTDIAFWKRIETLYNSTVNSKFKGPFSHRTVSFPSGRAKLNRYCEGDSPVSKGRYVDLDVTRLLRVGEADFDESRLKGDTRGMFRPLMFSTGRVLLNTKLMHGMVLFSTGDVEIRGGTVMSSLIVSGGKVTLGAPVNDCLIISKGSISAVKSGGLNNQIISGKKVVLEKSNFPDFEPQITECEIHPLGYIRWSQEPKSRPEKK